MTYVGELTDNELRKLGNYTDAEEVANAVPGSVNFGPMVQAGSFIGNKAYSAMKGAWNGLLNMVDVIPGFSLSETGEIQPSDWNSHSWGKYKGEMLHEDWFRQTKFTGKMVHHPPVPPSWWDEDNFPDESYYEIGYTIDDIPITQYYKYGYVAQLELGNAPGPPQDDPQFRAAFSAMSDGVDVNIISGRETALEGLAAITTLALLGWAGKAAAGGAIGLYAKNKVKKHRTKVETTLEQVLNRTGKATTSKVRRLVGPGVTRPDLRETARGIATALANDDRRYASTASRNHVSRDVKIPLDLE